MTFYEKLLAAGLPVLFANEQGEVTFQPGATLTIEQMNTYHDIVLEHFFPEIWAAELEYRDNLQLLRDNYITAISRLQQIQSAATLPFTANGFNQAQNAIKDEALIIERLLKLLKRVIV